MSKKRVFFISLLLIILSFSLVGCFSAKISDKDSSLNEDASLEVLLTDNPISDIDALKVFIKDMYFTYDLNGESYESTPVLVNKEYDVLSLAGTEVSLFTFKIPKGAELGTIHINVEQNATVVINNTEESITVAANGKLVIPNVGIDINNDGELVLDFDVASSLKSIGNSFMLIPVLKPSFRGKNVSDEFIIKGQILDVSNNPVSKAVITLSSTPTDESTILRVTLSNKNGKFYLGKYPNGEYDIDVYTTNITLPIDFDSLVSDYSTTITVNSENVNITINLDQ
uniref:DUF4382 domain-containing protein n=1 Tax=Marinitoga okinawensis TaxID=389480 RepID=A0A9C7GWE9_9BACT|nr:DUF4382 domain-containing protein [Marinitoga okinawensis]CAI4093970.1 Hypothetical protein PMO1_18 [Marinitoga okinawensis]